MPRKHYPTGCMVMTLPEFLAEEAKREGKGRTGSDIWADLMDDMKKDDQEQAENLMSDAEGVWLEICEFFNASSVDIVQTWEAWFEEKEEYAADLKDKFRTAFGKLNPNLKGHFKDLKAYSDYRRDLHNRLYKKDPGISRGEPHPLQLIRLLSAKCHSGFRDGSTQVEALVLCTDGKKRVLSMNHWSSSGSMMEPPDSDSDMTWREPTEEELR